LFNKDWIPCLLDSWAAGFLDFFTRRPIYWSHD
jgi:hypothetical protein